MARGYRKPPVTELKDKFVGYCAVTPNKKFMKLFERADIKNILISYHYIRKHPEHTRQIMEQINARGGLFMTDSGLFSFMNDPAFDANKFDWKAYVIEYTNWLRDNADMIFSACNLDADLFLGHDQVVEWNKTYFEPLQDMINVIYVAHQNADGKGDLAILKEYCAQYEYVAVNERMTRYVSEIYQIAKNSKTTIHGLAWTKPTLLRDFPFFSVDSSSWVNYQKYGATIFWDGANFHQYDKDRKDIRRTLKKNCEEYGVKFEEFCTEKNPDGSHNDDEGLTFSLRAWLDAFQDIKKYARTKLSVPLSRKIGNKMLKYMEQKTNNNAESGEVKKKSSPIDAIIAGALGDDVEVRDAKPIQYLQDEEGNEATLVYKREKKISIFDFMADAGDLLVCDNCHISDKCPKMKEHTSCAFDFSPKYVTENPISVLDHLITIQAERVNRATVFEKVEGGMPSKVVAQEINMLRNLNADKTNIISQVQGKGLKITQTIVEMEGRGNMIQTDGDSAPQGGVASILKGLLGA